MDAGVAPAALQGLQEHHVAMESAERNLKGAVRKGRKLSRSLLSEGHQEMSRELRALVDAASGTIVGTVDRFGLGGAIQQAESLPGNLSRVQLWPEVLVVEDLIGACLGVLPPLISTRQRELQAVAQGVLEEVRRSSAQLALDIATDSANAYLERVLKA